MRQVFHPTACRLAERVEGGARPAIDVVLRADLLMRILDGASVHPPWPVVARLRQPNRRRSHGSPRSRLSVRQSSADPPHIVPHVWTPAGAARASLSL
jgi:hypothetical protein